MKQNDLDRLVARMTGETVDRIQRIGFNLVVVETATGPPHRSNVQASENGTVARLSSAPHPPPSALAC